MKTAGYQTTRKAWLPFAQVILLVAVTQAWATECPPQQARSPMLLQYVTQFIINDYRLAGLVPHAANVPNPRPMPKISLHDLRKEGQDVLLYGPEVRELFRLDNHFYFAFQAQDRGKAYPDVINVPRASFWCLVREGDLVLLSDRVTHHSTRVFKVDREAGYVYFIDRWPDTFFLREGLNTMGIKARAMVPNLKEIIDRTDARRFPGVDEKTNRAYNHNEQMWLTYSIRNTSKPKEILELSKGDFLRTLVNLLTIDTVEFPNYYLGTNSSAAADPQVSLAFATTLLDAADRYADTALDLGKRALALAKLSGDATLERISAARIVNSATLLLFRGIEHQDEASAKRAQAELQTISGLFDAKELMRLWDAADFYRAGHAAGAASQLTNSIWYFDRAVELNPQYEEAYLYRGNAKMHQVDAAVLEAGDPAVACNKKKTLEEGIRDLDRALAHNKSAASAAATTRESRHPRDLRGIAADEASQKSLEDRSITANKMQTAARILLRQCE